MNIVESVPIKKLQGSEIVTRQGQLLPLFGHDTDTHENHSVSTLWTKHPLNLNALSFQIGNVTIYPGDLDIIIPVRLGLLAA